MISEKTCTPKKRYAGSVDISYELLTELLTLPEGVRVKSARINNDNFRRETVSIILESDQETPLTPHVPEGCMAQVVSFQADVVEEVKTVTTVRRVTI